MENTNESAPTHSLATDLAEADRLATAAWTNADDMPPWMYPAAGLWFASTLVCLRYVWQNGWFVVPLAALLLLEGVALGWIMRRRAAQPNLRRMPPEFRRPVFGYLIGLSVVIGVSFLLIEISPIIGFVFCAIASTAGLLVYRSHWYRAVDSTRQRVAAT